ncbi:MAG: YdcF family protein [Lachnospiraceae bacterium]|nr:YdcF family protein [Lachnospiraceae bacterium]
MTRIKKILQLLKISVIATAILIVSAIAIVFLINAHVKHKVKNNIISVVEAKEKEDIDCILVLGCSVYSDGVPSPMLQDRLEKGIELYNVNAAPKLLMSGDHGQIDYDEVGTMKNYAIDKNIVSEDIFMDHAGFSTYESIYRAKEIFGADKIIIVTQAYHLYRALYIADKLGVEAYGVAAAGDDYVGQANRDTREVLARNKDFVKCIFKPEPTYLGDAIDIRGNGDVTNN